MKKINKFAFMFVAFVFATLFSHGQTDTTGTIITDNTDSIFNSVIAILSSLGATVPTWLTALLPVILFFLRRWEKNKIKKETSAIIKNVVNDPNINTGTAYETALNRIADFFHVSKKK